MDGSDKQDKIIRRRIRSSSPCGRSVPTPPPPPCLVRSPNSIFHCFHRLLTRNSKKKLLDHTQQRLTMNIIRRPTLGYFLQVLPEGITLQPSDQRHSDVNGTTSSHTASPGSSCDHCCAITILVGRAGLQTKIIIILGDAIQLGVKIQKWMGRRRRRSRKCRLCVWLPSDKQEEGVGGGYAPPE